MTSHSLSRIPWVQPFQLSPVPARRSYGYCCHQESGSSAAMKTLGPAALKNPRWPNQHKGTPLLTPPSPKACRPLLSLGGHGSEGILFSPQPPSPLPASLPCQPWHGHQAPWRMWDKSLHSQQSQTLGSGGRQLCSGSELSPGKESRSAEQRWLMRLCSAHLAGQHSSPLVPLKS